jgi:FkbM family methyltransferase
MYEYQGWWFPDAESHFPKMLKKSIEKGGPAEYQYQVRDRSMTHTKRRGVALDIGANVGLWSRSLCKNFRTVVAFEPVAMFRECLLRNVVADNLQVKDFALGDTRTQATMIITEGNTGHTHIDPATLGTGETEVYRLDDLELDEVDYIKMDCEGYEYRILQGAEATIKRCRPVVVVEQKPHDAYSSQYGQHAAIELMKSWGMVRLDQVKDDWIMGWM